MTPDEKVRRIEAVIGPRPDPQLTYEEMVNEIARVLGPEVPPLPEEPYTVIRAQIQGGGTLAFICYEDGWHYLHGARASDRELSEITGFEVLSESRAVTAKAVLLGVVLRGITTDDDAELVALSREFGVES
jgi:hypothetical protein